MTRGGVRRRWPEGGPALAASRGRHGGVPGGATRTRGRQAERGHEKADRQQACCQRAQTDLNCFKPTNNNELPEKPCRAPLPPWRGPSLRAAPPRAVAQPLRDAPTFA